MRWIGFMIVLGLLTVGSGGALMASTAGWGLPGALEKPVNIREASRRRGRLGGPVFLYFGRTHYGGGYRGGK